VVAGLLYLEKEVREGEAREEREGREGKGREVTRWEASAGITGMNSLVLRLQS
jgi:hypothetical protein